MRSKHRDFVLRTWFVLLVTAASCLAQTQPQTATITGTVVDQTNFPISGAEVILKSTGGLKLRTQSDQEGQFKVEAQPGEYTLNISARGFKTLDEPISLAAATTLSKQHLVLLIGTCGPCGPDVIRIDPIELLPSKAFIATIPLNPLPPFKPHPLNHKHRTQ